MKILERQAVLAAVLVLLVGCNSENTTPREEADPKASNTQQISHEGAEISDAVKPVDVPRSSASPRPSPRPSPPPLSGADKDAVVPPDSAQAFVLAQLDEAAKRDLERGVLSPTTQLHADYKSEQRQEDWASFVEENLRTHFLNKKFSNVEVTQIGCKATVCEMLAVTRDSASAPSALEAWQKEVRALPRESWWQQAQMEIGPVQVSSINDRRAMFVTYLRRTP